MSRNVIRQLKSLRGREVNPSDQWVAENRQMMMRQIKNTLPEGRSFGARKGLNILSLFFPSAFVYNVLRPAGAAILILGLVTGGWVATVDASYQSLPGDLLYSTKRAAEKTQVAIASVVGDKAGETKLRAEFARRRAVETKKVVASRDPRKISKATQLVSDLKKEMEAVNSKLAESNQTSGISAEVAKAVHEDSEKIKGMLAEVKDNLLIVSSSVANLTQEVRLAKEMVSDTAVKAVEVMAVKLSEGDTSVSTDDVKHAINTQLQSTASEVTQNKQEAEGVRAVLETVKTEVREMVADSRLSSANSTGTQELVNRVGAAAARASEAVAQTAQASHEVDRQVQSAQQMVSDGNLVQAVSMVREANSTTRAAEQLNDSTMQAVQNVLPVVGVVKDAATAASSTAPGGNINVIVTTTVVTATINRAPMPVVVVIVSSTPVATTSAPSSAPKTPAPSTVVVPVR